MVLTFWLITVKVVNPDITSFITEANILHLLDNDKRTDENVKTSTAFFS